MVRILDLIKHIDRVNVNVNDRCTHLPCTAHVSALLSPVKSYGHRLADGDFELYLVTAEHSAAT